MNCPKYTLSPHCAAGIRLEAVPCVDQQVAYLDAQPLPTYWTPNRRLTGCRTHTMALRLFKQALVAILLLLGSRPGSGTPVLAQLRGRVSKDANPAVARFNTYIVESFLPLVKEAQAAGTVRADLDTEAVIELIDILWDGMTRRHAGRTFHTSYERVGQAAMALLTEGALTE